jgi:hypothetical protein
MSLTTEVDILNYWARCGENNNALPNTQSTTSRNAWTLYTDEQTFQNAYKMKHSTSIYTAYLIDYAAAYLLYHKLLDI